MLTMSIAFKEIYRWKKVIQFDKCSYQILYKIPWKHTGPKINSTQEIGGSFTDERTTSWSIFSPVLPLLPVLIVILLSTQPTHKNCILYTYISPSQSISRNLGLILNSSFSLNLRPNNSANHVIFISQIYHQPIHFSPHLLPLFYFKPHHLSSELL